MGYLSGSSWSVIHAVWRFAGGLDLPIPFAINTTLEDRAIR